MTNCKCVGTVIVRNSDEKDFYCKKCKKIVLSKDIDSNNHIKKKRINIAKYLKEDPMEA